jgi:hypothetical protein
MSTEVSGQRPTDTLAVAPGEMELEVTDGRVARPGPGPQRLRLVCAVQRPGRQQLAAPRDQDPASRPVRKECQRWMLRN